jgi:carbon-monoxide dehydrogenase medium subunit
VRAGYLSVSDVPVVVDLTPALSSGLSEPALDEAADLALSHLDPSDDIHASAAYRAQLVRTLTKRVVVAAHAHALTRSDP